MLLSRFIVHIVALLSALASAASYQSANKRNIVRASITRSQRQQRTNNTITNNNNNNDNKRDSTIIYKRQPKPCCLPYKFQAIVTPVAMFSVDRLETTRIYRNWEGRQQVQESVRFSVDGIEETIYRIVMDYRNMIRYVVNADGSCQVSQLDSGMLEPCMPDTSTYLGKSYIGYDDNKTKFDAWYFRRTDKNRNIEMTILVTSDKCVPVMEHIVGQIGSGSTDTLVLFTNLTEVVDESKFALPLSCYPPGPM